MGQLTVRHFTEADIEVRTALLRESGFRSNITDWAVFHDDEELVARQRTAIEDGQESTRLFTVCRGDPEEITGFAWASDLDWLNQTCELSLVMLPRFRGAFGSLAVVAVLDHLYAELNLRVVLHRILEHNTMLHSADQVVRRRQLVCPYDGYTAGRFRGASYWTQTAEEFYAGPARTAAARRERRERIMAATR